MVELVVNNDGTVEKPSIIEQLKEFFVPELPGRRLQITLDAEALADILHQYFHEKNKWLRKYHFLEIDVDEDFELDIYFTDV